MRSTGSVFVSGDVVVDKINARPPALDSLNVYSSAVGAYALRQLFGSYTGPHVKIRRSSDSAEADIWFDGFGTLRKLTTATATLYITDLNNWLNGATAYVTTWYDQSGQGNHGTQTSTAAQPSLDLANGWMVFDSNDYFNLPNGTVPAGNSRYSFMVYHGSIASIIHAGVLGSGNYGYDNQVNALTVMGGTKYRQYWWNNDFDITPYAADRTVAFTYDQSARRAYINGSQVASLSGGGRNSGSGNNTIGRADDKQGYLNGELNSVIIWDTALSGGDVSDVSFLISKTGPSTLTFDGYNRLTLDIPPADIQSVTLRFTPTGGTATQETDEGTATEFTISETGTYSVIVNGIFVSGDVVVDEIVLLSATGGTVTYITGYTVHTFTSSGDFVVTSGGEFEYLIVGGGGGGGHHHGGGGGAGGMVEGTISFLDGGTYPVIVGGGGAGGTGDLNNKTSVRGQNGGSSSFSGITAIGGGGGGSRWGSGQNAGAGGSGGGSGYQGSGGAGLQPSSSSGGFGNNGGGNNQSQSGGGGAGGVGQSGGSDWQLLYSGGIGKASSINGTSSFYAAGGQSGGHPTYSSMSMSASGVGGVGAYGNAPGGNGVVNTGSGGGGGGDQAGNGGRGGSGIVIIRYAS